MATVKLSEGQFRQIYDRIVDNFEGGYYHPDMYAQGRISLSTFKAMGKSGETMFGIDRVYDSPVEKAMQEWKEFWGIMDAADAKHKWKIEYMGGNYSEQLRALGARLMHPEFDRLCKVYVTQDEANIIMKDSRLCLHFAYGALNGEGWFHTWLKALESGMAAKHNKEQLFQDAVNIRSGVRNVVIARTGPRIRDLFKGFGGIDVTTNEKIFP